MNLFPINMIVINKFKILWSAFMGYGYKLLVDIGLLRVPELKGACDVIVSLTSYGRRVSDCVIYYTLVSLLRQKLQPSRIILWLAQDEWSDEILPKKLLNMKKKGIEICYCKDYRSYKKLIPTLAIYPDKNIVTVDDDIIYNPSMILKMWEVHKKYSNVIICMSALKPILKDGIPQYYQRWQHYENNAFGFNDIFPVGCGGIFYPKGALHRDVLCENLFTSLCPMADDIWFWFCGLLNGTKKNYIRKDYLDYSFDIIYQYFHKGSALTHSNRFENENDKQFYNLFTYYNTKLDKMEY